MSDRTYASLPARRSRKGTPVVEDKTEKKETKSLTIMEKILAASVAAFVAQKEVHDEVERLECRLKAQEEADAIARGEAPTPASSPAVAGEWTSVKSKKFVSDKSETTTTTTTPKKTKADPNALPDHHQEMLRRRNLAYKEAGFPDLAHLCVECLINPSSCSHKNEIESGDFYYTEHPFGYVIHTQGCVLPISDPQKLALALENASDNDATLIAQMKKMNFKAHDDHRRRITQAGYINVRTLVDPTVSPHDSFISLAGLIMPPTAQEIQAWINYHNHLKTTRLQFKQTNQETFGYLKACREIMVTFLYYVPILVPGNTLENGRWTTLFVNPASWFCGYRQPHPEADPNKLGFYPNGTVTPPQYVGPLRENDIEQIAGKYSSDRRHGINKFSGPLLAGGSPPKFMCVHCCDPIAKCNRSNPNYFHRADNIVLPPALNVQGAYTLWKIETIYHELMNGFTTAVISKIPFVPSGKYPATRIPVLQNIEFPQIPPAIGVAVHEFNQKKKEQQEKKKKETDQSKFNATQRRQTVTHQSKIVVTGGRFQRLTTDGDETTTTTTTSKKNTSQMPQKFQIRKSHDSWADDVDDADQKGHLGNHDAELSADANEVLLVEPTSPDTRQSQDSATGVVKTALSESV